MFNLLPFYCAFRPTGPHSDSSPTVQKPLSARSTPPTYTYTGMYQHDDAVPVVTTCRSPNPFTGNCSCQVPHTHKIHAKVPSMTESAVAITLMPADVFDSADQRSSSCGARQELHRCERHGAWCLLQREASRNHAYAFRHSLRFKYILLRFQEPSPKFCGVCNFGGSL